ncbi:MAG: hypothetical protein WB586_09710 [Chthoniobacterales bacterium]
MRFRPAEDLLFLSFASAGFRPNEIWPHRRIGSHEVRPTDGLPKRRYADTPIRRYGNLFAPLFMLAALLLTSCNRPKIEVYRIPKENIQVATESNSDAVVAPPPPSSPVNWTKPEGWEEQPLSEMRQGSFRANGPNGAAVDISVISFPGEAGGVESNINRWRGQVQLPPLAAEEIEKATQHTTVDGKQVLLVDIQTPDGATKSARILGAILQTADRSWFVKMTGDPNLLEAEKPKFLEFVQSFRFGNAPPAAGEDVVPKKVKSTNDKQ